MGVPIDELKVQVDGDIDLQGMLILPQPSAVRPGYHGIMARYFVKSKSSRSQLEQVKKMAYLSPTWDSLRAVRFSSELVIEIQDQKYKYIFLYYFAVSQPARSNPFNLTP